MFYCFSFSNISTRNICKQSINLQHWFTHWRSIIICNNLIKPFKYIWFCFRILQAEPYGRGADHNAGACTTEIAPGPQRGRAQFGRCCRGCQGQRRVFFILTFSMPHFVFFYRNKRHMLVVNNLYDSQFIMLYNSSRCHSFTFGQALSNGFAASVSIFYGCYMTFQKQSKFLFAIVHLVCWIICKSKVFKVLSFSYQSIFVKILCIFYVVNIGWLTSQVAIVVSIFSYNQFKFIINKVSWCGRMAFLIPHQNASTSPV